MVRSSLGHWLLTESPGVVRSSLGADHWLLMEPPGVIRSLGTVGY